MIKTNEISELKDLTAEHVTRYKLDEINKIKDYLNSEIKERKDIIKKISKYIAAFDYISIVWYFKYCFICNGCWNTCRRSKLNIIENLISQALIDFEITHEEFSKLFMKRVIMNKL